VLELREGRARQCEGALRYAMRPDTLAMIERAVPLGPPGEPPVVIFTRAEWGALLTLRSGLRFLLEAGRIRCAGEPGNRRYWREPAA
jgi:hypothetical protein